MTAPETHRGVWVFLEQDHGKLLRVGLELLGKGRELADQLREPLTGVLLGQGVGELAQEAVRGGADEVLVAEHALLEHYTTDPYCKALAHLVEARGPNILLVGSTPNGRDLAGRLAVRLRTGLTANAVRLEVEKEKGLLLAGVPGFGGSVIAMIKCERGRPQMSTVRPGVFQPLESDAWRPGRVERVPVELHASDARCRVVERTPVPREDLAGMERVIVAGLGTGGDLAVVDALAAELQAAVGVTRPLVDMGVAPRERQVGSTGIALRGKVAIVLGASGASHFTSGLADVKFVVAVNRDPRAAIFEHADVGVVGDLGELLPALLDELRAQKRAVVS